MKTATADKDNHVGDPDFYAVPVDRLTSKEHAAEAAARIRAGEKHHVERIGMEESKQTTHVAVIDAEGNAVTMTHSLGMPSGVITDGLGFMFNGCMGVFDPRPGRAGSIAPGKSRFSSLCPTIAFKDGEMKLAIGAPGGTQIAMGVMQGILNVLDHDMTMTEAVSAPRFSSTSDIIDVTNRIPRSVQRELEGMGYEVVRHPEIFGIAALHGIRVLDDGTLDGGADPGHDGVAIGVRMRNLIAAGLLAFVSFALHIPAANALAPEGEIQCYKGVTLVGTTYPKRNSKDFFRLARRAIDMVSTLPKEG